MSGGRIAQLGERLPYKQEVTGSNPVSPTIQDGKAVLNGGASSSTQGFFTKHNILFPSGI